MANFHCRKWSKLNKQPNNLVTLAERDNWKYAEELSKFHEWYPIRSVVGHRNLCQLSKIVVYLMDRRNERDLKVIVVVVVVHDDVVVIVIVVVVTVGEDDVAFRDLPIFS